MVRSPVTPKHSKWSYLRARPRMGKKPANRTFLPDWEDTPPNVLGKTQRSSDAVSPSFTTTSGSREAVRHYKPKVMTSVYESEQESELDEDPFPPSIRKLILRKSSEKALSAEPLSNLPPSEPSERLKDLYIDNESSHTNEYSSEFSRKTLPLGRPVLNIISEPYPPESKHLPVKKVSTSFGKKKSGKLDFEAGTIDVVVPTCQGLHQTVSMNRSAAIHGTEKYALKKSKNRRSRIQRVEVPESSQTGNEQLALAEKHMPDVTYMPYSCTPVAQEIQMKQKIQYTSESQGTKCSPSGSQQGVVAKKCMSNSSVFVPQGHSTPLPSVRHIISIGSSSIPMELSSGLARRRTTATQWKTQPASSATEKAQEVQSEEVSPVIPKLLECGRTRNGKRNAQLITESSIIPKLQECTRAKKPIMDTHEVWDQVHLCDQPSGYTAGSDESEEASPGIPKLQECGQTRKGKRDAQLVTESPVIPKLQERTRAKKPKMDSHDLQLSPSVATVQKHAQRKKRKRPKVWVQVRLYDQPGGLRTKEDVTMYDIYLSLALEIIEVNRQQCQSKKGKKVMDQFYKEVAKDAIGMIDELQLYTNELVELQQEIMKMMRLRKELDRISRGLGKYVRENDIRNVDPYQFYFEDEEDYYV
ncbi:uncharacterized protein LOC119187747 isoform X4 [Rhipicephalus microplus]|uniref:uncharacterized protein LOC119187747 isoform X4 n=1 Tax=Rhipicephalus microplus TaxID=6941 RepID=UPI003F6C5866